MNEVIILEGPDGAGKTTLAEGLIKQGFRYEHSGVPKKSWTSTDLFRHYVGTLRKAQLRKEPVVYDRHYLGETVYGPICRDRSLLSRGQVILLERLVRAGGSRVVVCLPSYLTVVQNWMNKKDDYVQQAERLSAIYDAYQRLMAGNPLYERYNYQENGGTFKREKRLSLPPGVIGSPNPRLLLVGEQVNTNLTSTDWAFFANNGSSGFLNDALIQAGIPEQHLAFMNARDANGRPKDLGKIVQDIQPLVILALGKVAERDLHRAGLVVFQTIPHPQHTKRFGGPKALDYYAQLLKEAYEH